MPSLVPAFPQAATAEYRPAWRRPIADTFRRTAQAAVRFCVRHRIHPDAISYSSVVASSLACICFVYSAGSIWLLVAAPLFCYLRLWLNMLDGMVALASRQASPRGEILNDLPDRISDVLIFAGVAHSGLASPYSGYWAAILALLTAYVGTLGQAVGVHREFSGLMSKPWRMAALHVGAWAAAVGQAGWLHPATAGLAILDWTCIAIAAGCVQTMFVRLRRILSALDQPGFQLRGSGEAAAAPATAEAHREVRSVAVATQLGGPAGTRPAAGREGEASRRFIERTMTSWDGVELSYRWWPPVRRAPEGGDAQKALILFHRGHEHAGRWQHLVDELDLEDVAIFAWDARGHGRSSGERGAAESTSALVKDADAFVSHVTTEYGIRMEDVIVLGHSVGAVIAAAWVHDYAPMIRGMILATPAFRVKLYVPGAIPLLRMREALFGPGSVKSYVKASLLTHDAGEAARYRDDALIFRQISVNLLLDLYDTSRRLVADAGAIHTPTLILSAGRDWIVRLGAQRRFFAALSSSVKEMRVYPGFFHAIFHERDRRLPIAATRAFIAARFAEAPAASSLLNADAGGYTKTEHDRLRGPGGWAYLPLRWAMKTIGRLSNGMRLGWRKGFDSGLTLDYVYEDRPRGITPLGRLIDRAFLSSAGWRGIRQRRIHLERTLHAAVARVQAGGRAAHLLDIAAGPGRYVLEAVRTLPAPVTAELRDRGEENLQAGRRLADALGVRGVTFARGDAFDGHAIAVANPRPNVAIVSGLYELFPDNARVMTSLRGLADAVDPGGYLIYTNQPWHPQLELIARTLVNREGRPWVMRRRTQAEMDGLVRAAGFRKVSMEIDRWGIFTVSLAERIAP